MSEPVRPARKRVDPEEQAERAAEPKREKPRDEIVLDVVNERALIRAALAERERRDVLTRTLAPDEFLDPRHAAIWRALRVETDQGLEHDAEAFVRIAGDEGIGDAAEYLAELERGAAVPENLEWRVATVRWDACRARIAKGALPDLIKVLKDPKANAEAVSNAARAIARAVEGGGARRFIRRGPELSRSYKAELRARIAAGNFWPWGFEAIDQHWTEGAMPKRTALVVGLSGSGKSTFVAELVVRLARAGRRVLYGAWEMGTESTLDLMAASMARVELTRVVQGDLDPEEELVRIERCVDWLTSRIQFFDNPFFESARSTKGRADNNRSLDVLEGYIAESGCDVVVYDLWERMLIDLGYEGVTKALYRQQNMHETYNVYGVMVHQLKGKEVEARADKRPTREGVKGSGAFVETCDQLIGIHRDAQFRKVPDDTIEAICLKQRKGKAFWASRFEWDPERALVSGEGVDVPYDPGLESSEQFGDVDDIKVNRGKRGNGRGGQRKPSRRDG